MIGTTPWRSVDAVIVGGGPAGAMAAIGLARASKRVLLIEKEALPRYKPCGGGLVWRARESLPFDISAMVERECRQVLVSYKRLQRELMVEDERPLISMVMRPDFDLHLIEHARNLGVEVIETAGNWQLHVWQEQVLIELDGKMIQARWLIAGDGAKSRVARKAGWKPFKHLVPAIECELAVDRETVRRFGGSARFDLDFPSTGYGWVFPKREHLSVGVCSFATLSSGHRKVPLKHTLQEYLRFHRLPDPDEGEQHGYVIPVAPRAEGVAKGRVLLVGDAAGLADPVTAEGLSHALHSGVLAAQAIVAGDEDDSAVIRYSERMDREILPDLRQGRWLSRLLYSSTIVRKAILDCEGERLMARMVRVFCGAGRYRDIQMDTEGLPQSIDDMGGR